MCIGKPSKSIDAPPVPIELPLNEFPGYVSRFNVTGTALSTTTSEVVKERTAWCVSRGYVW